MRFTVLLFLLSLFSCGTSAVVQEPGVAFPDFSLASHDGQLVTQADLRGSRTVIWFYPKAATPG
jgi:cytochrome oxidase Cu insertion factor (SCO1/SenC/PrrC family)